MTSEIYVNIIAYKREFVKRRCGSRSDALGELAIKRYFAVFGDGFVPSHNKNAFRLGEKLPYFFTIHYYLLLPKIDKVI